MFYYKNKWAGLDHFIGNVFMGTVGYADDVVVLAPTVNALKSMLNICDVFGTEYQVLFNSSKYQLLHYSRRKKSIKNIVHSKQVMSISLLLHIWDTL